MKCKYCGCEFEQPPRGKRKEYCNKKECLKQAKNEAQRKWYAKKLEVLKGSKHRIVEQKGEKKIVYSSTDKVINNLNNEDFTVVIELARELGAVRFKILEEIKKCYPNQSICDKEDQIFLHDFEELAKKDEVYTEEIVELFVKQLNKRQNRRAIKDKEEMLKHLIQGVISNPDKYVFEYIKNRNQRSYNPKIKEEA